jgi:hypothetical protein
MRLFRRFHLDGSCDHLLTIRLSEQGNSRTVTQ